jgi:ubiquinone/menaquinone biosynthesis C-methylase UbiE
MNGETTFFDFAAEVGLTKHFGGAEATAELAELCHIGRDSYVLDVGCGVGVTSAFLAKKYGCRVVGVDIREKMVLRSKETAQRHGVADRVEFRVADVQNLPLEDSLFDAVLSESVTSFPEDKAKAIREYVRVTKTGGYVALGEATWLKMPPPPEFVAWLHQDAGATAEPLTSDAWVGMMKAGGLSEIANQIREVKPADEGKGLVRRYGRSGMLRILLRTLRLYLRSPDYRAFVKSVRQTGVLPQGLAEYFAYGLYVGKK